jgi:murein DD-endopeptidase MepM/ murein hydrolase activator NlpD
MTEPAESQRTARADACPRPGSGWGLVAALAVLVAVLVPFTVVAQTSDDEAERAAREIQAARDRANAAADAVFQAQSDLDVLQEDLGTLELEAEQLQATVDQLRGEVENVALARFVNTGASGIPLLTGLQAPQDQVQAEVYVDVLTNTGNDALDQYDVAQKALVETEKELAERRAELEDLQVQQERRRDAALEEVEALRAIEEQRLRDEAVRKALEAQQAAERARLEELARQEAEAAAAAAAVPEATAAPADTAAPSGDSSDSSSSGDSGSDSSAPAPTSPPPAKTGPSGGTSGGKTGSSGSGSSPSAVVATGGYVDQMICPMPGSAYSDTWGAPRSGGRTHQGVDMLAPMGTPMYAVVSGSVSFKQNSLGGNAAWLTGNNGNKYYYAHLSRFEGSSRSVGQGEVIGYNGDTGNASGIPHLHFEIHPGGGVAVNPTPSVRGAGC